MKAKEKELLTLLYQNRDQFLTSQKMAWHLDLSERTVRTYIKRLSGEIEANGGKIIAKQGSGYQLILNNASAFENLVHSSKLENLYQKNSVDSAQERKDFILQKLLLENRAIDQYSLADQLCISESTLKKDFSILRPLLDSYSLSLINDSDGKLRISGNEENKRALIMDYFFRNAKFTSIREYIDHSGYFDDVPSETLLMIILDETRKENLILSDIMMQNVMVHLALSIKRIKSGLRLEKFSFKPGFNQASERRAAAKMIERLSDEIGMAFPEEEIAYLTLHMAVKTTDKGNREKPENLEREVVDVLQSFHDDGHWDFERDELLKQSLLDHLPPMIARLHQGIKQSNPLTESITNDEPALFNLVKTYFSKMPSLKGLSISDDEWAYLALHIMAAAERIAESSKLQVLVICATGYGSSQLIHSRLMKYFSNSIHIVSETGYFSLNDDILKGVDLIISSVNMGSVIFGVPFLHVSVFLTEDDVSRIQKFIDKRFKGPKSIGTCSGLSREKQSQIFHQYFSRKRFLIFDHSYTAEDIVDTLVSLMAHDEAENFTAHMKDQIRLRNKMGNVAFSDTVAVPHPAMPLAETAGFAVGIAPDGVYWDKEHPSIRFIILMSPSYRENEGLKEVTQAIVRLLEEDKRQENMLNNPTFEQFEAMFRPLIQ